MTRRLLLCLCLLTASLAGRAGAAPARPKAAADSTAMAPAKKNTAPARPKAAADSAAMASVKKDATPSPTRTVAAPRRLEDIHIEGEIPAPQVLFITARDQRRFTKFHHRRYLKPSVLVGETTLLPTRVALTSPPSTPAGAP